MSGPAVTRNYPGTRSDQFDLARFSIGIAKPYGALHFDPDRYSTSSVVPVSLYIFTA
jgi:hypothetical protein